MDFFGILFDMKNGKKVPYSKTYFDTLFAAKLAEMQIKTLTGTLPLTFRTSETALRSWTIYGNNYEHKYSTSGALPLTFTTHTAGNADEWSISGNDNVGKNLLEITAETQTLRGVTFTVDKAAGTITLNGDTTQQTAGFSFEVMSSYDLDGTFILSGGADGGSASKYDLYMYDAYDQRFSDRLYDSSSECSFTCVSGHKTSVFVQARKNNIYSNIVFRPMLRLAGTSPEFEPYQIGVGERTENLFDKDDVETGAYDSQTGEKTDAPALKRTANPITVDGGTVYRISNAGGSIRVFEYQNDGTYIGASLVNTTFTTSANTGKINLHGTSTYFTETMMLTKGSTEPSTYIPYGYEIPISVNGTPQTFYIGSTPLTAGQSISKTSTGVDIAAIAGTNNITTELYNKPEMAIEGVDYVGVGRPRGQDWEIRLVCVGKLSPYKPNAPESDTSYVYNATDYTLDTDNRYKTALIDIGEGRQKIFTIGKTKGETFTIQPLNYMAEWGGVDHYNQIGQTITPTEETYTGETAAQYLLVTYYDSEVDTLTPKEIRESITLTATVDAHTIIPIDAPLTEGQTVTKESTGVDIETFPHAVNSLMEYATDYSDIEASITYKGG